MKVLFITPSLAAYVLFLRPLCRRLMDAGHEVHFASAGPGFVAGGDIDEDIQRHSIELPRGANPVAHLRAGRRLRKLIHAVAPDYVEVHYSAAMLSVALAHGHGSSAPIVATVHGLRFPMQTGLRRFIERIIETWAAKRMDEVVVLTDDDRQSLVEAGVTNAVTLRSSGIGCDLNRFDSSRVELAASNLSREKLGIGRDDIVVVFIGRFVRFKGFATAVRAFCDVARRDQPMHLLLCGAFDEIHDSGLTDAEQQALAAEENIHDLGWIADVEKVLSISDICLFPSSREGMPVNLMESLAMGVPVITCDTRGCRDVVTHESDGLVVPCDDEEATVSALATLVGNPEMRNRFSSQAIKGRRRFDQRNYVEERFSAIAESNHFAAQGLTR